MVKVMLYVFCVDSLRIEVSPLPDDILFGNTYYCPLLKVCLSNYGFLYQLHNVQHSSICCTNLGKYIFNDFGIVPISFIDCADLLFLLTFHQ